MEGGVRPKGAWSPGLSDARDVEESVFDKHGAGEVVLGAGQIDTPATGFRESAGSADRACDGRIVGRGTG